MFINTANSIKVVFLCLLPGVDWTVPASPFSSVWADRMCVCCFLPVPPVVFLSALLPSLTCPPSCVALTDVRILSICSWSFICCCCAAFSRSTSAPPAKDVLRAAFSPADEGSRSAEKVKYTTHAVVCEDYTLARCRILVQSDILIYFPPSARRCRFSSPPQLSKSLCPPAGSPWWSACGSVCGRTHSRCIFLRPGWRCHCPSM